MTSSIQIKKDNVSLNGVVLLTSTCRDSRPKTSLLPFSPPSLSTYPYTPYLWALQLVERDADYISTLRQWAIPLRRSVV